MKIKLLTSLFLAFTLASSSSFSDGQILKKTATSDKSPESVLFIQNANKGTLKPMPGKKGYYLLTLKGVKEYTIFFTDRPHRTAGIYPTIKFLEKWQAGKQDNSFNKVPPNAALSAIEIGLLKNTMINTVFQLSNPTYDAKHETVTYQALPLEGLSVPLPERRFKNIALFIDSYCASCAGHGF